MPLHASPGVAELFELKERAELAVVDDDLDFSGVSLAGVLRAYAF